MPETHSRTVPGGRGHYLTERLWELAAGLPVTRIPIESIAEFDIDCWFGGRGPSIREVADHLRRVQAADLSHPVILNADGGLMDGGHRLVKAWLAGDTEIASVRFISTPTPDWVEPTSPADRALASGRSDEECVQTHGLPDGASENRTAELTRPPNSAL